MKCKWNRVREKLENLEIKHIYGRLDGYTDNRMQQKGWKHWMIKKLILYPTVTMNMFTYVNGKFLRNIYGIRVAMLLLNKTNLMKQSMQLVVILLGKWLFKWKLWFHRLIMLMCVRATSRKFSWKFIQNLKLGGNDVFTHK